MSTESGVTNLSSFRISRRGRVRLELPVAEADHAVLWIEQWDGLERVGGVMISRGGLPVRWVGWTNRVG